jgi:tripartite-type tricarboxylate transporter receptor subunit TctC
MQRRFTLMVAGLATLGATTAHAQAWPTKPVTFVVPSAPGGTTDFTARLVSDGLAQALGQPVVIDNKAGGAGNIGNQLVARAKPDGYTLLVSYSGYHVGNPHLFKQAGWDPIKDFAPVAMMTRAPQVIVVNSKVPFNDLAGLIDYAKKNPGKLNYASSGNGSIQHIAGELFKQITGTFITHIPYRGAGPATQDLIGGQVDLFMTTPAAVVAHVQAGKLKALAVTGTQRLAALPNVPTANEAGLKGFELDSWFALYAPAGTPPEIVQRLNTALAKVMAAPDVKKKAADAGTTLETMSPAQLGDYTQKELERWGKVIKGAKITMD